MNLLLAEILKLKRTLALRLAISTPALIIVIVTGMYLERGRQFTEDNPLTGFAQLILTSWSIIVFPLFTALTAAMLAATEHQNDNWKQLFAMPVNRRAIFGAKWIAGVMVLLASCFVLAAGVSAAAEILRLAKPALNSASLPVGMIFRGASLSLCAAGLLFSIQMWISLRWRSFLPGIVVAVIALAVMFISVPRGAAFFGSLFPWSLPAMAMAPRNPYRPIAVTLGLLGGATAGFAACWDLARREFR